MTIELNCKSCKTNAVGKNSFYCDNCWNHLFSMEWGDLWTLVCHYQVKHPEDEFAKDVILVAYNRKYYGSPK